DADFLAPATVMRCIALVASDGRVGVAALDASTGELRLFELPGDLDTPALRDELLRLDVAELIIVEGLELPTGFLPGVARTSLPVSLFDLARADDRLLRAVSAVTVAVVGIDHLPLARRAGGALLAYCERARLALPPEFLRVRVQDTGSAMRLDPQTRRNLELLAPLGSTRGPSLVSLLDRTRTPMGARLVRAWLQEPLLDVEAIQRRADAVESLVIDRGSRHALATALNLTRDLERLIGRAVQGSATPRDLGAIRDTCVALAAVRAAVADAGDAEIAAAAEACTAPDELTRTLGALLVEDPPSTSRDGGSIRPGADQELDALLQAGAAARTYIAGLEDAERERTGIRSLRAGYNRVFGYYLEVPNAQRSAVPPGYMRKQTLVGAERYITAELKEQESVVLHARERAVAREQELLRDAARAVAAEAPALLACAAGLATLDALQSLATVADEEAWMRPTVDGSEVIDIDAGRHPLVERALGPGRFVPNGCTLDAAERVLILTGPNMAGKSTYLRQVAVIVLLAQVGSFVPAARARIGVCDRIFTRLGAQDDISGGMSTFMVEMTETASILRQATARSLVILDEIGRGTSTYDGLSIAQAVIEHLHDSPHLNCRTLFATHYHELTQLAATLPRVRNARVEVEEEGDRVAFLHRIVPGGADRSYGIHVAKLAGVPAGVLARARQLLEQLERSRPLAGRGAGDTAGQLTLGISAPASHPLLVELAELELDTMSPLAALNKLAELHQRAGT
ncbi:MAG: DNA mismatch repair protein MutS, partial [Candidatus Dormibacteraeota bacterium]|nr:DNA mismatch repair protein MutS [Candidatus Dormibacteraeota bacterium]